MVLPARLCRGMAGKKRGGLRGQHRYTEPTNTQHDDMADPMSDKLHLTPEDEFPEDLETVPDHELQVLDSQVQRQLDHEVVVTANRTPKPSSATTNWTTNSTTATNADAPAPGVG